MGQPPLDAQTQRSDILLHSAVGFNGINKLTNVVNPPIAVPNCRVNFMHPNGAGLFASI
jgi:hypothetical protein